MNRMLDIKLVTPRRVYRPRKTLDRTRPLGLIVSARPRATTSAPCVMAWPTLCGMGNRRVGPDPRTSKKSKNHTARTLARRLRSRDGRAGRRRTPLPRRNAPAPLTRRSPMLWTEEDAYLSCATKTDCSRCDSDSTEYVPVSRPVYQHQSFLLVRQALVHFPGERSSTRP